MRRAEELLRQPTPAALAAIAEAEARHAAALAVEATAKAAAKSAHATYMAAMDETDTARRDLAEQRVESGEHLRKVLSLLRRHPLTAHDRIVVRADGGAIGVVSEWGRRPHRSFYSVSIERDPRSGEAGACLSPAGTVTPAGAGVWSWRGSDWTEAE